METITAKASSDGAKLATIMTMIENVLEEVVKSQLLFSHNLRDNVVSSWKDVQPNLISLRRGLRRKPEGLKQAGLTGSNLNLKYQGIFESYERLNRRGGIRRLRRFLRWGKLIVGSITTMVPGLKELAEILNEYIEAVDMGIEDAEAAE